MSVLRTTNNSAVFFFQLRTYLSEEMEHPVDLRDIEMSKLFSEIYLEDSEFMQKFKPLLSWSEPKEAEMLHHLDKYDARLSWCTERYDSLIDYKDYNDSVSGCAMATMFRFPLSEFTEEDLGGIKRYFEAVCNMAEVFFSPRKVKCDFVGYTPSWVPPVGNVSIDIDVPDKPLYPTEIYSSDKDAWFIFPEYECSELIDRGKVIDEIAKIESVKSSLVTSDFLVDQGYVHLYDVR